VLVFDAATISGGDKNTETVESMDVG